MNTPHEYCKEVLLASGSNFQASFIFLSTQQRQALTAVYAFCREVDNIVDEMDDKEEAANALTLWQQRLDELYSGNPSHPITQALALVFEDFKLEKVHFETILNGMWMDLKYQGYETFEDLKVYCQCVASAVGLLACEIFGYQNKQTLEAAKLLGIALQLVNIIRDVGKDAELNRVYFPEGELKKFNLTPDDLLSHRYSQHFSAYMSFNAERARQYYQKAMAILPTEDRYAQRFSLIMAKTYFSLLSKIEKAQFKVFDKDIRLSTVEKLWIAWRTFANEKKHA